MDSENNEDYLLNVLELAEIFEVRKSTIYKFLESGEVPTVRVGRQVRVRAGDLQNYLREQEKLYGKEKEEVERPD
jgi:excisionase family DNA binding protein